MHKSGCPSAVNASGDCNSNSQKHLANGYANGGISVQYSTSSTALDVVRHYVNPAVYIESKISVNDDDMVPFKKSPSFESFIAETPRPPRILKVKRCVCLTNSNNCPMHENCKMENDETTKLPVILDDTARSETDSGIRRSGSMIQDELRLSIPSLTSINTAVVSNDGFRSTNHCGSTKTSDTESDAVKEQRYRDWCDRKDMERRLLEHKENLIKQIKEKQKEFQIEKERDNFKKWLANKKLEEEAKKRKAEDKIMRKKREEEDLKQKRLEESKLTYQVWLRRKEEKLLERKIKEQLLLLKTAEEKQKRDEYNRKAYELWLIQSKNKPKPIPLNQGLQTLKSSASVTYINPKPWVPNVDIKPKPASQ